MEPETSKKKIYSLEDSMFIFWYRFVFPNTSNIVRGLGKELYYSVVQPHINDFMGKIFEKICIQYMYQNEIFQNAPFFYGNIGRWRETNPQKKCQEEINLLAGDEKNLLLGECKWTNDLVNIGVLRDLEEQSELFYQPNKFLYLFAKKGFTNEVISVAKNNSKIHLIDFSNM